MFLLSRALWYDYFFQLPNFSFPTSFALVGGICSQESADLSLSYPHDAASPNTVQGILLAIEPVSYGVGMHPEPGCDFAFRKHVIDYTRLFSALQHFVVAICVIVCELVYALTRRMEDEL